MLPPLLRVRKWTPEGSSHCGHFPSLLALVFDTTLVCARHVVDVGIREFPTLFGILHNVGLFTCTTFRALVKSGSADVASG